MGVISLLLQVFVPYTRYVYYLKFLVLSLLAYVVTAFLIHIDWPAALKATVLPPVSMFHGDYLMVVVAVLGTTISPYLFFWQASQEAEEVQVHVEEKSLKRAPSQAPKELRRIRIDTYAGMAVSNAVAFFIMLTSAATLHAHGITKSRPACRRPARWNHWLVVLRMLYFPWESLLPDCWPCRSWGERRRMPWARPCAGGWGWR
jgi:Mn2+/Fe2+ NRAMP family transporter